MNPTRRSFLRGALSLAVVAASGLPALNAAPLIVGDGVHDDTAGLQALFDGKPFVIDGESIIAERGRLIGGRFKVSDTLRIRGGEWSIFDCHFIGSGKMPYLFSCEGNNSKSSFSGIWFDWPGATA